MYWRSLVRSAQEYVRRVQNPYPPAEKALYSFASREDLKRWKLYSDATLGGGTFGALEPSDEPTDKGTACFKGTLSSAVTDPSSRLRRSGFCGINLEVAGQPLSLEDYDTVIYRVRGDGRRYIASLRTENWIVDDKSQDVWQAFIFARKGEWTEVEIPLKRFLQTWKGRLVDNDQELDARCVTNLGISIAAADAATDDGPFQLDLDWIRARRLHATY